MRSIVIIVCAILTAGFLLSCVTGEVKKEESKKLLGSSGSDGVDDVDDVDDVDEVVEYVKKTGGLEEIAVDSEQAIKAYSFVKEKLAVSHPDLELYAIQKAFTQVVAGHAIILICEYSTGDDVEKKLLVAKTTYDPEGNQNLTELVLDYEKQEDENSGG